MEHNTQVLYEKNDQVKVHELGRSSSTHVAKRNMCTVLMGKPEGERPLESPRREWEDNA
jgi:hypothetical protein